MIRPGDQILAARLPMGPTGRIPCHASRSSPLRPGPDRLRRQRTCSDGSTRRHCRPLQSPPAQSLRSGPGQPPSTADPVAAGPRDVRASLHHGHASGRLRQRRPPGALRGARNGKRWADQGRGPRTRSTPPVTGFVHVGARGSPVPPADAIRPAVTGSDRLHGKRQVTLYFHLRAGHGA